jgi:hypothetical protein
MIDSEAGEFQCAAPSSVVCKLDAIIGERAITEMQDTREHRGQ